MDYRLELSSVLEDKVSCLLKWTFIAASLLSAIELTQTAQKQSSARRRPVCITLCDIFYVLFNLLTVALYVSAAAVPLTTGGILTTDVSTAVALGWITISMLCQRWRGFCASSLPPFLHACSFVAAFTDLLLLIDGLASYRIIPHEHQNQGDWETTLRSLVIFGALGSFLCACFRSSPVLDKATSKINTAADEETFSPCGRLVGLAAITHIINSVRHSKIIEDNIRPTIRRLKCRLLVKRLYSPAERNWTGPNAGTHVMCAFVRVSWCEGLWVLLTGIAYFATVMVRVPLLEALIEDIANQDVSAVMMLFIAACTAEVGLAGFVEYLARRLCVQLKFLVQAALFSKMTRMSSSALSENPAGYFVSMATVDAEKCNVAVLVFSREICGILSLPVLLWMLAKRVGVWPVAGCIAWQLVSLILFVVASKLQAFILRNINHYRDERLRKMADTLSCVRLVKFYAWEEAVAETVTRYRKKEGFFIFLNNMLHGFIDSLQNSSSSVMTIILFGTIVAVNGRANLTPARAFSSLYMLSIVEVILINMATNLYCWSMAWQSVTRVAKALTAEEGHTDVTAKNDNTNFKSGTVLLDKCEFAWSGQQVTTERPAEGEIALIDVNLDIAPGALVGVVGLVGSGKSALLEAMLGELQCLAGTVHISGRVAYVPQAACIFNMSIRDNVLFGKAMEPLRYTKVLEACELMSDLDTLPAGDLTEVGEKGETLSGGQKQRVALARAAYSDSDIYLMDDTLSALDVHVACKVFAQVIGPKGCLRNKTRIVVSNQGQFLASMDKLVLLWEKCAIPFHSLSVLTADSRAPKTLLLGSNRRSSVPKVGEIGWDGTEINEDSTLGRLTSDEVRDANSGTMDVLRSLSTMCGLYLPLAILSLSARAVTVGFSLYWIKLWIDTNASANNDGQSEGAWITVLGILCLCDLVLGTVGGCLLAVACRRLSMRLHAAMLRRVLSCAVSFFDATPRGRILNRFSADLDQVDSQLYLTGKQLPQTVTVMLARMAVVGTQVPAACVFGVIAILVYLVVMAVSLPAASAIRSLESVRVSRMLQHLTETRDSMSTVRCFGAVTLFNKRFYRLVEDVAHPYWVMTACVRVTRVSAAIAGLCSILATVATLALSEPPTSQSGVGLALSSAMSAPMILASVNAGVFFGILAAVALQRALEYTRLTPEDDCCKEETEKPHQTSPARIKRIHIIQDIWPTQGKIVFDNFTASYRPGVLPPVLDNLAFSIEPYEKVGVIGRTGAGKSSLILALLRVLRPCQGRVVIDNVDISSVPLRKLRSVITVIPQEPYLMKGSLRDNLDGMRCHSDDQIWEALRRAHMEDFVSSHPDGLLLEIDDGAENLSAGQRQLLCLARALLRTPRVLLLDEATSRMDGDTDRLIQQTLRDGFASCTVLTVAHRLNTVLHCDRILVMKEGSIAEFGTVGELAANPNSVFRSMARAAGIDLSTLGGGTASVRL